MSVTTLEYTDATPGADANTYTLFNSVSARWPGNAAPHMGIHSFHWDIKHSQAGTVRGYYSKDRGASWTQFYDTGSLAAPTYTDKDVVLIEGFSDFKFEWVNGGAAQATWSVLMDVSVFP